MAPWLKSSSESHWNVKETNELRHFKFLHSIFFNLLHSCFDKRTWLQHEHGDHGRSEFYNFHLHLVADCVWSIGSSPVQKTCAELIKTDQNCTKWSTLSALTCNNPKRERECVCVYRRVLVLMILLDIVRAYCAPGLAFNHSIDQIKLWSPSFKIWNFYGFLVGHCGSFPLLRAGLSRNCALRVRHLFGWSKMSKWLDAAIFHVQAR